MRSPSARCLLVLAALCLGCSDGPAPPPNDVAADSADGIVRPPTAVSLQLNWFPEAEHGGFFAADVHGFYDDSKLDVEIRPGGPGTQVVTQVATGRVADCPDTAGVGLVSGCVLANPPHGIAAVIDLGRAFVLGCEAVVDCKTGETATSEAFGVHGELGSRT